MAGSGDDRSHRPEDAAPAGAGRAWQIGAGGTAKGPPALTSKTQDAGRIESGRVAAAASVLVRLLARANGSRRAQAWNPQRGRRILTGMAELKEGSKAPDFTLTDDAGRKVKLSEFADKTVVLYFYPRADTPGCTKEACSFRDHHAELLARGAVVLGVSPDEPAPLAKFKQKYGLPFPLLADPDHKVAEKYGVWVEKNMYGRKTMGIERSTFLIHHGKIAKIFRKVKVDGHTEEVLAALDAIAG